MLWSSTNHFNQKFLFLPAFLLIRWEMNVYYITKMKNWTWFLSRASTIASYELSPESITGDRGDRLYSPPKWGLTREDTIPHQSWLALSEHRLLAKQKLNVLCHWWTDNLVSCLDFPDVSKTAFSIISEVHFQSKFSDHHHLLCFMLQGGSEVHRLDSLEIKQYQRMHSKF